jgi:hypothetical protein
LQFSFLVGGGCAKSQILTRFSFFKHCVWTCYYFSILASVAIVAVQSQISFAHFCNIDRKKYLKFEPSTTSHCEHFVLNFRRNHGKVRSWCNFYELPFEVLEMCFLHCSFTESSGACPLDPLLEVELFVFLGGTITGPPVDTGLGYMWLWHYGQYGFDGTRYKLAMSYYSKNPVLLMF